MTTIDTPTSADLRELQLVLGAILSWHARSTWTDVVALSWWRSAPRDEAGNLLGGPCHMPNCDALKPAEEFAKITAEQAAALPFFCKAPRRPRAAYKVEQRCRCADAFVQECTEREDEVTSARLAAIVKLQSYRFAMPAAERAAELLREDTLCTDETLEKVLSVLGLTDTKVVKSGDATTRRPASKQRQRDAADLQAFLQKQHTAKIMNALTEPREDQKAIAEVADVTEQIIKNYTREQHRHKLWKRDEDGWWSLTTTGFALLRKSGLEVNPTPGQIQEQKQQLRESPRK